LKIYSRAFGENGFMPERFALDGRNVNPELEIRNVPDSARSLALIMDDPDAPKGRFVHWAVWNIDPETQVIPEKRVPSGAVEGMTSAMRRGYMGPCPPSGIHHYVFKLYALDTELDLPPETPVNRLEETVEEHAVDYAEFTGVYQRK